MTEQVLHPFVKSIDSPSSAGEVPGWLARQAGPERPFLLVYADDGVIWGRWWKGKLVLSNEIPSVSPPLRGETVQSAFVFGESGEVRLYRDELGSWQARLTFDPPPADFIEELQILSGDDIGPNQLDGFTHLRVRGQNGLDQLAPLEVTAKDIEVGRLPRLIVHHILEEDKQTGETFIRISRLAGVDLFSDS